MDRLPPRGRLGAREKILAAAAEIAHENGAGNLSLDAVAARAGVSKGGLLYHFPTKAALMRASVESFVSKLETQLEETRRTEGRSLLSAFVELTVRGCLKPAPGAAGVLAAIADDPDFLKPVRAFQRRLLDRLLTETERPTDALLIYLALEGLRSMQLLDLQILTQEEYGQALQAMLDRAD